MPGERVPVFQEFMNPILAALRSMGGTATVAELDSRVSADMKLSPDILAVPHKPEQPDRSEVSYRMAWARTYLKYARLLANPTRGTWKLTDEGAETHQVDEYALTSRAGPRSLSEAVKAGEYPPDEVATDEPIAPELSGEILSLHATLLARGAIFGPDQTLAYYRRFRDRFGPAVLQQLDGERLLTAMHGRQTKDSLVYWLEFKDDDEFPARFGSIAGGSALKFGLYQSKEGNWWTGTPQKQVPLTATEAVELARRQRDQLVAGGDVLQAFSQSVDADYSQLQSEMVAAAPELADSAWGHKYFALLFPHVLDDYHALTYQQYHLIKLLRLPGEGRYINAGILVPIARALGLLPTHLGAVLNQRNGSPHEYWRVGTTTGKGQSEWARMRDGGFMAIGWSELSDLSDVVATQDGKTALRLRMDAKFSGNPGVVTRSTQQVFNFVVNVNERDVVVAMDGGTVRGIGIVRGPYYFQSDDGPFAHRHMVEWRDTSDWTLPESEQLRTTFIPLGKHKRNLVAIERRLLSAAQGNTAAPRPVSRPAPKVAAEPLTGTLARIQSALDRKLQVVLFGPPGTGKTYYADLAVRELVARSWFGKQANDLSTGEVELLRTEEAVAYCTFHPGYGYEDFIEGYRPAESGGAVSFRLERGLFKQVCARARANAHRQYFVSIDEINRGDIPRIFGELLTLLEKDKRGRELTLPVSRERFSIPENVRIVATMNTADRSIAMFDTALRRRFAFVELMPSYAVLEGATIGQLPVAAWLRELNERIVRHVGRVARNLQVGHAYMMQGSRAITDPSRFLEVYRDDVLPLLEEYCYSDGEALASILGAQLMIRETSELPPRVATFDDGQVLVRAFLESFEGLATAPEAIAAEVGSATQIDEDDDSNLEAEGQ